MRILKKLILVLVLALSIVAPAAPVFASNGLLPQIADDLGCDPSNDATWPEWKKQFENPDQLQEKINTGTKGEIQNILGCALRSGEVQWWMVGFYVIFILEFIIELAGLIVVAMIVVGAYFYIIGGITEDKEKGKTIITHALGGFALVLSSWIITNIILLALTS